MVVAKCRLSFSQPLFIWPIYLFTQFCALVSSNVAPEGVATSGFSEAQSSPPLVPGAVCRATDLHSVHLSPIQLVNWSLLDIYITVFTVRNLADYEALVLVHKYAIFEDLEHIMSMFIPMPMPGKLPLPRF
ncbi:unnamed protein product [Protopolystoma xenopodis]|uniref:Uncharacterized protein n=1 Tax=Protopolystoma xenopodis TaxID=117903 RepID=A0A448WC59_9PLAT|nr:unnamed protein product [Protopolystoma xenopodis]